MSASISQGTVYALEDDIERALRSNPDIRAAWDDLTPLARNEWICWITSPKKPETRTRRLGRMREELLEGKRRPCCWPGCPHRTKLKRPAR